MGPGDVPLHDPAVRLAFFKEVGQQSDFQACLEHDFVGANARARRIDERRAKEFPAEALKRPATRIATTILMYSFGGLRREGANETEMLPPGITETDLLAICVAPSLDAVANLADMAGKVAVTVKAENPDGFDKAKLQNGVIEPLREANLIE